MGIGIWAMHFIGMLAYSVGIPLRYHVSTTLFSLLIAVGTSGFALHIAGRAKLSTLRLSLGSLVMGAGIASMHYSGMAAIQIVPGIRYDPGLVAASVAIAVLASWAALWLAFRLQRAQSVRARVARFVAAIMMGLGICGMHYTGMAACNIEPGSICFGGATLDNHWLAAAIGLASLGLLALTLVTSVYHTHLTSQAKLDADRLAEANMALTYGKNLLSLTTKAAGICSWEFDIPTQSTVWAENVLESLSEAGVNPNELDTLRNIMHPEDLEARDEAVRAAIAAGRDRCSFRVRVRIPDGSALHLESHSQILFDSDGNPSRMLGVTRDITESVLQGERERDYQAQLRVASREAGMAEVATGVLHNIGNVLNSLGVASSTVRNQLDESRANQVSRVATLLVEQGDQVGDFLLHDRRGQQALAYLSKLGESLVEENEGIAKEIREIQRHVEHIGNIVAAQQTYARRGGVAEQVNLGEALDATVTLHFTKPTEAKIHRDYARVPPITLDRHKLLQILGNLLTNARQALLARENGPRELTLRIGLDDDESLLLEVEDTGIGIDSAGLQRLFEFGFTTKVDGHGFGLHTCALLATELGGSLTGHSDGPNRGARFRLRLPRPSPLPLPPPVKGTLLT